MGGCMTKDSGSDSPASAPTPAPSKPSNPPAEKYETLKTPRGEAGESQPVAQSPAKVAQSPAKAAPKAEPVSEPTPAAEAPEKSEEGEEPSEGAGEGTGEEELVAMTEEQLAEATKKQLLTKIKANASEEWLAKHGLQAGAKGILKKKTHADLAQSYKDLVAEML